MYIVLKGLQVVIKDLGGSVAIHLLFLCVFFSTKVKENSPKSEIT